MNGMLICVDLHPVLHGTSFTMNLATWSGVQGWVQEWDKCLHLNIWIVEYHRSKNATTRVMNQSVSSREPCFSFWRLFRAGWKG